MMPKIGNPRPAGGGWKTQVLNFGRAGGLQRGYVKIISPEGECIDTALTVTSARKRIRKLRNT